MSELCWDFTSGINLYITSCWTPSSLPLALPSPSLLMLSVPPGGGWRSLCGPSSSLVWHLCLWSQQPHAWVARHFYVFGFSGAILCAATDCCPQGFCGEYVGGEQRLLCPGFFPARQMPSQPQIGHSAFTTVKWPAEGWLGAGFNSFTTMRYDTLMELNRLITSMGAQHRMHSLLCTKISRQACSKGIRPTYHCPFLEMALETFHPYMTCILLARTTRKYRSFNEPAICWYNASSQTRWLLSRQTSPACTLGLPPN